MKLESISSNIESGSDESQSFSEFTRSVHQLFIANHQVYELIGRVIFIAYRYSFYIDHFSNDCGSLIFLFDNGEEGDFKRHIRLTVSI